MTQTAASPRTTGAPRRPSRRFDQARATLLLLLASAGMLGYSAVQAIRPHPGFGPPGPGIERTTGTTPQAAASGTQNGGEQP